MIHKNERTILKDEIFFSQRGNTDQPDHKIGVSIAIHIRLERQQPRTQFKSQLTS
jgi:hypothetical protein